MGWVEVLMVQSSNLSRMKEVVRFELIGVAVGAVVVAVAVAVAVVVMVMVGWGVGTWVEVMLVPVG